MACSTADTKEGTKMGRWGMNRVKASSARACCVCVCVCECVCVWMCVWLFVCVARLALCNWYCV